MPVVNPDGTPGNVAPDELIESAWGNATADTITKINQWTAQLGASVGGPEVTFFPGGSIASIGAVTVVSSGRYLVLGSAVVINRGASGIAQASLQLRVNGANIGLAAIAWLNTPAEAVTIPLFGVTTLTPGSRQLDISGTGPAGTPSVGARQIQLLRIQ